MRSRCSDDDEEEAEDEGKAQAQAAVPRGLDPHARKLAAQALIDLSDKLAACEQENGELRRRLHDSRSLSKVCVQALCAHNRECCVRTCGKLWQGMPGHIGVHACSNSCQPGSAMWIGTGTGMALCHICAFNDSMPVKPAAIVLAL